MGEMTQNGNASVRRSMKLGETALHRIVGARCYTLAQENRTSKEEPPMSARHPSPPRDGLNHRALAMLRAVVEGRAELTCSREPDLFIDGVPCCDQFAAHGLAHDGLIEPAYAGDLGQRVPATVTAAG